MDRQVHLNLDHLPWPINVLKFNRAVYDLQPGEEMLARVMDGDVVGNLRQLLNSQAGLHYDIEQTPAGFHLIRVARQAASATHHRNNRR